MAFKVNREICIGCGVCVETCPEGAITIGEDDDLACIDPDKCQSCGLCAGLCAQEAIEEAEDE